MKCVIFGLVIAALVYSLSAEIRGRIFNSQRAVQGQFKYVASVLSRCTTSGRPPEVCTCGGSLIAPNWILTAAHCLHGQDRARIYLGAISRQEAEITYRVKRRDFILHPLFSIATQQHDIALIRIPKTTECDNIKFARIPNPATNNLDDKIATTMGWGFTSNYGDLPSILRWAQVKTLTNDECSKWHPAITDTEICVNTTEPYGSPCVGDSGGPLELGETGELIGVLSTSAGKIHNCEACQPAIYMRVASYMPWISTITGI